MNISKNLVLREYASFKVKAEQLYERGNYEMCLKIVALCAHIAYTFQFRYADEQLENQLAKIGKALLGDIHFEQQKDRYVFYDHFGIDNRGLTQQYIRALMSYNVEFLYIVDNDYCTSEDSDIIKELKSYPKSKIHTIKSNTYVNKIKELKEVVEEYAPEVAFLHLSPWDVVAAAFWSQYKIKRYFINLTDHAFWLGVNSADYFLEFRKFGVQLSSERRGIPRSKMFLAPYYPITNSKEFAGFPEIVKGNVIGFSGAAYYKIYGKNGQFLKLIKRALDENPNFIFLFAGAGNPKTIKKFIQQNNFEDRFILLGNRKDINEVFKHVDIYINTFPLIGALMTQLAIINRKPLLTYSTPDLPVNFMEFFLNVDENSDYTIYDEDTFSSQLNDLIRSEEKRSENVERYAGSIPTMEQFNANLMRILSATEADDIKIVNLHIDYEATSDLYLETENDYLKTYDALKFSRLGKQIFYYFPISSLSSLIRYIINRYQNKN